MNEPINSATPQPSPAVAKPRRRKFWLIAGVAGALATLAACAPGGHHHGRGGPMGMSGPMDPEQMSQRIDKGVNWLLSDVDATAEQKQKVAAIVKQAAGELAPLRDQHRQARKQAMQLVSAPTIDRAAMEKLRTEQMQLADQASRRFTQALADVSEVLTPEQRVKLRERAEKRMGRRWS